MVADLKISPASRFTPAACPRLVIKIGSALLVDQAGAVRRAWLAGVVTDIANRRAAGQQIVVVSSGAIALGARRLGLERQWLHAVRLGFEHPDSGEHVEYESPYPADLAAALETIRDER